MNQDSRSFEEGLAATKADLAVMRSNYVTRSDLQEMRIELKAEIQNLRSELKDEIGSLRSEVRSDYERLRAEIQTVRAVFYKALDAQTWKIIASSAALVTAVYFLVRAGY